MTPKGGPLLYKPGGDNTPPGKISRGCGYFLMWLAVTIVAAGLADWAQHWWEGR